jgi:hypothetical protein
MLVREPLALDGGRSNHFDMEDEGGNHECSEEYELDAKTSYDHPLADLNGVFRSTGHDSTSCLRRERKLETPHEMENGNYFSTHLQPAE